MMISIFAQNTWTGNVNNRWDNAGNWSYGYIPIDGEDILIDSGAKVIIPTGYNAVGEDLRVGNFGSSSKDSLIIRSGATLSVNEIDQYDPEGFMANEGTINSDFTVVIAGGDFINSGTINISINWYLSFSLSAQTFINNGQINCGILRNGANFTNNGTITLSGNGDLIVGIDHTILNASAGIFENNGTIIKNTSDEPFLENTGIFKNEAGGSIEITNTQNRHPAAFEIEMDGGVFSNKGSFLINTAGVANELGISLENSSTFDNKSSGILQVGPFAGTPVIANTGSNFINQGSCEITQATNGEMILGTGFFDNNGGTLTGNGTISITNFTNDGILAPGQSPGKITRDGNSNIGGVLYQCELAGTAGPGVAGGHDLYEVTQNLNLDGGQVNVSLLDGFVPNIGDQFTIVSAGISLTNTFGTTNLPGLPANRLWQVNYTSNEVVLEVIANPLPVELIGFKVKKHDNEHQLKWATASEINTIHFEIQHSTDSHNWSTIDAVLATGESTYTQSYGYKYTPIRRALVHYYRLKIVDMDGSFEYSDIRSLEGEAVERINISPNPFDNWLHIDAPDEYLRIYDSHGVLVHEAFASDSPIDLSHLPGGMYFLQLANGAKNRSTTIFKARR